MRKLAIAVVVLLFLCLATLPAAFADNLQDAELNVNGTTYCGVSSSAPGCLNPPVFGPGGYSGLSTSGGFTSTGQGTVTITVLGTACSSCNVDLWLFDPVGVPFYNEYGATSGSASTGESWQIDVPDYDADGNTPALGGSIIANTDADTLANTNYVPGITDDYLLQCGANGGGAANSNCNDNVSMALGFDFTSPGAGNEEIITFVASNSGCEGSGICLEDVHPVDGNNTSSTTLYYSASAESQPVCTGPSCVVPPPPTPEPSALLMLGSSLCGLLGFRRKLFGK